METSLKLQDSQNPSLLPSPSSHSTTSSSSSHHPSPPQTPTTIPITRSEPNNPYPTTFVQADTSSFKQVVQMLTGSSEKTKSAVAVTRLDQPRNSIPPIRTGPKKDKACSKLFERRGSLKNFKISPLLPGLLNKPGCGYSASPRKPGPPEILSPSLLDFPSLVLSPVTPLIPDPFNRSPHSGVNVNNPSNLDVEAEDKAIAKKGFFVHPYPGHIPRDSELRLLPLFPVTPPRVSGRDATRTECAKVEADIVECK